MASAPHAEASSPKAVTPASVSVGNDKPLLETPKSTGGFVLGDTPLHPAVQLSVAAVAGVIFGFALNKAAVYQAGIIRSQFKFTSLIMLKVFLTAAATSMFIITLLYARQARSLVHGAGESSRSASGLFLPILGGFILGAGMAVSGSCPGTIWSQLGAGSVPSLVTLAGGLVAALVYGLSYEKLLKPLAGVWLVETKSLNEMLHVSRTVLGLLMSAVLAGIVALLFLPYPAESPSLLQPFDAVMWNPIIPGIIIGAMQLPLLLTMGKNVGCSSSFVTVMSALSLPFGGGGIPYLKKFSEPSNWWQVLYVACAAVGSYIAYVTSEGPAKQQYNVLDDGVEYYQAFLGGFLIVIGARIGNGCTSGHGISGFSHLALRSMLATAMMFVGGIVCTFIFFPNTPKPF
jgi:uncharacterized membrane protein YedE/YeeE